MQICQTIESIRAARRSKNKVAFVPTMGNLHEGHISLMNQAKEHADAVIASIFVNRLQFGPNEDFDKYPRTFEADCQRLCEAGVDILFAPTETDLYPEPQEYTVEPPNIQHQLDGEFRPGHFSGVATVVLKLFNIVQPDVALFGKKDYQQLMVIRNMTRQFALPIEIIGGETVRANDGLALSSRNGYLSESERTEATRLSSLLQAIQLGIRTGNLDFASHEANALAKLSAHGWITDYVAVRRQKDLQIPTGHIGEALVVLAAARLGKTRLIDNIEI
jgi:pantoate--beta-alanine ligase